MVLTRKEKDEWEYCKTYVTIQITFSMFFFTLMWILSGKLWELVYHYVPPTETTNVSQSFFGSIVSTAREAIHFAFSYEIGIPGFSILFLLLLVALCAYLWFMFHLYHAILMGNKPPKRLMLWFEIPFGVFIIIISLIGILGLLIFLVSIVEDYFYSGDLGGLFVLSLLFAFPIIVGWETQLLLRHKIRRLRISHLTYALTAIMGLLNFFLFFVIIYYFSRAESEDLAIPIGILGSIIIFLVFLGMQLWLKHKLRRQIDIAFIIVCLVYLVYIFLLFTALEVALVLWFILPISNIMVLYISHMEPFSQHFISVLDHFIMGMKRGKEDLLCKPMKNK